MTLKQCDSTQSRAILLQSISQFLEKNGFSKTLKYFRKEAQLQNDGGDSFNVEELCFEYLKSRNSYMASNSDDGVPASGNSGDDSRCQIARAMKLVNSNRDEFPIKIIVQSRILLSQIGEEKKKICTQFHLVDLNIDRIYLNYTPSKVVTLPLTKLCGRKALSFFHSTPPIVDHHSFTLVPSNPECVSLYDKVYAFGRTAGETVVLDPTVGVWRSLFVPANLLDLRLCLDPVPDPGRRRILMRLQDSSTRHLYAFNPDAPSDEQWKCIARDFYCSVVVSAIVDDVIYFHSHECDPSIRAFDLVKGEWLKVCEGDTSIGRWYSTALFHLGSNVLCLAAWLPQPGHNTWWCSITFSTLIVKRSGAIVTISRGTSYSYSIPAIASVQKFLPIYMEQVGVLVDYASV